jgi:preprotein translocase subunit SecE
MAKSERDAGLWGTLLSGGLYKRNQGKLVRQLTMAAILVIVLLGVWALWGGWLADLGSPQLQYGIGGTLVLLGLWFSYRIVNYPPFAEFLIDVEGEMVKVTWPSRDELQRATVVVLATMFLFSVVLFGYDVIWQSVLRAIQILQF